MQQIKVDWKPIEKLDLENINGDPLWTMPDNILYPDLWCANGDEVFMGVYFNKKEKFFSCRRTFCIFEPTHFAWIEILSPRSIGN